MGAADLDASMDLILEALPEYHGNEGEPQRRKHALTRSDMELIIAAIKVSTLNQPCSLKFTEEQATDLLKIVKERKRILALIGAAVLAVLGFIGQKTLDLLAPGIWKKIGLSITHFFSIGGTP